MFSHRFFAHLGIVAALVVLIGSMSVLLHGREHLQPSQQTTESTQLDTASQMVFSQTDTALHR